MTAHIVFIISVLKKTWREVNGEKKATEAEEALLKCEPLLAILGCTFELHTSKYDLPLENT